MNREQLMLAAKRQIDARRQKAVDECDKALSYLRAHDDWKKCESTLKSAQVQLVLYKDANAQKTVAEQKLIRAELLAKYGVAESDLVPQYTCKKCEDTGYDNGQPCSCLQTVLRALIVADSNVANKNFTFENSAETNKHNLAVYNMAKKVCEQNSLQNILLTGGTGTGKTYLLSSKEFGLDCVIVHGTEGHLVADFLAKEGVPVITGPVITDRSKPELANLTMENTAILARAGVQVAICTDHPETPIALLPFCAAMAARAGMDEEEALAAITINAACIAGVGDRLGSLSPGKEADIVVMDGHPFHWRSRAVHVFIGGEKVTV